MNNRTEKEHGEFHTRFCPFANLIYRIALIVTGRPGRAKRLQADIYLKAFIAYLQAEHVANFKDWLAEIVIKTVSEYKQRSRISSIGADVLGEAESLISEKLSTCKQQGAIKTFDREAIDNNEEPLTQR